jgi:two-component system, NtrC family, nitrogen regulation response regulator NtrX
VPTVLIADDEPNIRRMVGALLTAEGHEIREAPDGAAAVAAVAAGEPDAVLLDLMMPGAIDGLTALERIRAIDAELPVIMMSGRAGLTDAVRATKLGAINFLEKPLSPEAIVLAVASAMELRHARRAARALREELGLRAQIVGTSQPMRRVTELIQRVAPSDARVLITGESGTGKELVAVAIHQASPRRDRPFVRVNCAAIPRDLVESEMFGHERGAFTGATERRIGRFELAHTGTLLLDEVGDLGAEAQAKLLRAIETREIERVGGGKPIKTDVRILAATNKDLTRAVADGSFREDLLFRLNVIPFVVPPLREHPDDIPALVEHFARSRSMWTSEALAQLERYTWPGNVRELANIVERLAILHPGEPVSAAQVRDVLRLATPAAPIISDGELPATQLDISLTDTLDAYERLLINRALTAADGNVTAAARRLQTDRPNLYRRMRRLGIRDPE